MGRMRKETAEYFPHFTYKGRTLTVLEKDYGCEGYTFWFKLLELLCESDKHCYDCSKRANMKYLAIFTMVSEEKALEILNLLADMEKIDAKLWNEKKLIWCQTLVNRLIPLYAKRTTAVPRKPLLYGEAQEDEAAEPQERQEQPQKQQNKPETPQGKPESKDIKKHEKPPKKAADKPTEPPKIQYAEFVNMTEAEHQKLVEKYGTERTALFIQKLDNAKGAKGYKYKSDYRAILNWVVTEVEKELQKKGGSTNAGPCPNRNDTEQSGGFRPSEGFRGSNT